VYFTVWQCCCQTVGVAVGLVALPRAECIPNSAPTNFGLSLVHSFTFRKQPKTPKSASKTAEKRSAAEEDSSETIRSNGSRPSGAKNPLLDRKTAATQPCRAKKSPFRRFSRFPKCERLD
jgi:hypothetical protein